MSTTEKQHKFHSISPGLIDLMSDAHAKAVRDDLVRQLPTRAPIFLPTHKISLKDQVIGLMRVRDIYEAGLDSIYRPRLRALKEKYEDRTRCFVIGNGPSLNRTDLAVLEGEVTFAVNGFFLKALDLGWLPTFYVVEDHLVAEDRREAIEEFKGPTKLFPAYLGYCFGESDDTIFLNHRPRPSYPDAFDFSTDAEEITYAGCTVVFTCLQLAFYLGFKEIYLIGVDSDYSIPSDTQHKKDYGIDILDMKSDDPNHFHPDYFGKGYRWHDPQVGKMLEAYAEARRVADSNGRSILNATVGGKLEVFERVPFAAVFPEARSSEEVARIHAENLGVASGESTGLPSDKLELEGGALVPAVQGKPDQVRTGFGDGPHEMPRKTRNAEVGSGDVRGRISGGQVRQASIPRRESNQTGESLLEDKNDLKPNERGPQSAVTAANCPRANALTKQSMIRLFVGSLWQVARCQPIPLIGLICAVIILIAAPTYGSIWDYRFQLWTAAGGASFVAFGLIGTAAARNAARKMLELQELEMERRLQQRRGDIDRQMALLQSRLTVLNKDDGYSRTIRQIREVTHTELPRDATVLVISKGDDELLNLSGRRAWHFPQAEDGRYAGHHPADSASAIAHLEALRSDGADFLLVPNTALWWFDHYREFKQHLNSRYRRVSTPDCCIIYQLSASAKNEANGSALPTSADAKGNGRVAKLSPEYQRLIQRIRDFVSATVPEGATVLVVSRGDEELLQIGQRSAWHFPRDEDGTYADSQPADGLTAIGRFESLRTTGAQFLLLPQTAFWWSTQYQEFIAHLYCHYRVSMPKDACCMIFQLTGKRRELAQQPSGDRATNSAQPDARLVRAKLLSSFGKVAESETVLVEAVEQSPTDPMIYKELIRLARRRGDISLAARYMAEAEGQSKKEMES